MGQNVEISCVSLGQISVPRDLMRYPKEGSKKSPHNLCGVCLFFFPRFSEVSTVFLFCCQRWPSTNEKHQAEVARYQCPYGESPLQRNMFLWIRDCLSGNQQDRKKLLVMGLNNPTHGSK